MGSSFKSMTLVVIFLGLFGVAALSIAAVAGEGGSATPVVQNVVHTEPSYPFDLSDKRILVGAAEYVFLGQVIEQVGNKGIPTSAPDIELPQTQFSVKVLKEIKGDLPDDQVVVSQSSGVDKSSGDLVLVDGDPLLKSSETVLFVVNYDPDLGWYQIAGGPFGATRAKDAREAETLVAQFQEAERTQFVPAVEPSSAPQAEHATKDRSKKDKKSKRK